MKPHRHLTAPVLESVRRATVATLAVWLGLALPLALGSGCRGIGRYGESRQSIAARRLSRQGHEALHAEQWELAEGLFVNALDLTGDDDRAHWGLAESLWHRGERQAALKHMEEAVRLSASDPRLLGRLGKMYLDLDRLEDASRQSLLALETDRVNAEAWGLRGDCLLKSGEHEAALAAYHQALALQPDFPEVQLQIAEIYRIQGRYDRLLATIDRLQETMVGEGWPCRAHLLRGIALQRLHRSVEAQRCFEEAGRVDPSDPDPHLYLAALMLEQSRFEDARRSLQAAIVLAPQSLQAIELAEQVRALGSGAVEMLEASNETSRVASGQPDSTSPTPIGQYR